MKHNQEPPECEDKSDRCSGTVHRQAYQSHQTHYAWLCRYHEEQRNKRSSHGKTISPPREGGE